MPKHHETAAAWWRQLLGASYVWWALAAIVTAGLAVTVRAATLEPSSARRLAPVSVQAG